MTWARAWAGMAIALAAGCGGTDVLDFDLVLESSCPCTAEEMVFGNGATAGFFIRDPSQLAPLGGSCAVGEAGVTLDELAIRLARPPDASTVALEDGRVLIFEVKVYDPPIGQSDCAAGDISEGVVIEGESAAITLGRHEVPIDILLTCGSVQCSSAAAPEATVAGGWGGQ